MDEICFLEEAAIPSDMNIAKKKEAEKKSKYKNYEMLCHTRLLLTI
jgi:hypothetical protein